MGSTVVGQRNVRGDLRQRVAIQLQVSDSTANPMGVLDRNLVARGAVKKNGKKYKGLPSALASAIAPSNGHLAGIR